MSTQRPNILLIMADQLRRDHVGWNEGCPTFTPNLNRLAEGVVFDRAYTVNPVCQPARAALLTGKYPSQIGCLAMSGDLLPQHPTFPRALQAAGYETALIGKLHVNQSWPWGTPHQQGLDLVALRSEIAKYGFDHIFEVCGKQLAQRNYCDFAKALDEHGLLEKYCAFVESEGPNTRELRTTEFTGSAWPFPEELYPDIMTTDAALRFLGERDRSQPFFMHLSYCSPHPPFDPPERLLSAERPAWQPMSDGTTTLEPNTDEFNKLQAISYAYQALVELVDEQVGRVLDHLKESGQLDSTVILFVTDHGEMLGDHGRMQKMDWRESSAHIPLAIRHPDYLTGQRSTAPAELTDLAATCLDFAGVDPTVLSPHWPRYAERTPSRSLRPVLEDSATAIRDTAYAESPDWQMVTDGRYKYVRELQPEAPGYPVERLYDVEEDPTEVRNLIDSAAHADCLARLKQAWLVKVDEVRPAQVSILPWRGQSQSK